MENYEFISNINFPNNQINLNKNLSELKIICNNNSNYIGFNTDGNILTKINFKNISKLSNKQISGLYLKNNNPEYIFIINNQTKINPIFTKIIFNQIKLLVNYDDYCLGFDSNGKILYKLEDLPIIPNSNIISGNIYLKKSGIYIKKKFQKLLILSNKQNLNILLNLDNKIENIETQFRNPYDNNYKIFCINLEKRLDRKNNIINIFNQYNIPIEFFKAIDGSKINLEKYKNINNYGIIGCALSHYLLYEKLLNDPDYNQYLIIEDDIQLINNFDIQLNSIIFKLGELDWEIILLGHHIPIKFKKYLFGINQDSNMKIQKFNKTMSLGGSFGYIINKNGAKKLIKYINNNSIKYAIDIILLKLDLLKIFEVFPHLIYSKYVGSSINLDSDIQIIK